MLNDCEPARMPDGPPRENLRVPELSELPHLSASAKEALRAGVRSFVRDLDLGRIRKPDYHYMWEFDPGKIFSNVIIELQSTADKAWSGDTDAIGALPDILRDYLFWSSQWFGSSMGFFEDLTRVREVANATLFMVADETLKPFSDEWLKAQLRFDIGEGGFISQDDGVQYFKRFGVLRDKARELTAEVTLNTKRGPRGPRGPRTTSK